MRQHLFGRPHLFGSAKAISVGLLFAFLSDPAAQAFQSVTFSSTEVSVTDDYGGVVTITPKVLGQDVSGFSGFAMSADRRYVGWQTEQVVSLGSTPIAISLLIVGPHSRLEITNGQQVHSWWFLPGDHVQACFGPTHGLSRDTCSVYSLPE